MNFFGFNGYITGAARLFVGKDILKELPKEALVYGTRIYLTGTEHSLAAVKAAGFIDNLDTMGFTVLEDKFAGQCSDENINSMAKRMAEFSPDLVIATGGGRCIDTTKVAAVRQEKPIFTVPTIAATCAAAAPISVIYYPDGRPKTTYFNNWNIEACFVDINIVCKAPKRYFAAGMGDAFAKLAESYSGIDRNRLHEVDALQKSALAVAEIVTDTILQKGVKAYLDIASGNISEEAQEIALVNIGLTNTAGILARHVMRQPVKCVDCCSKDIGHSFHNLLHKLFPSESEKYLHGELVALFLLVQYKMNGESPKRINEYLDFYRQVNLPTKLADLGIGAPDFVAEQLLNEAQKDSDYAPYMHELREAMNILL